MSPTIPQVLYIFSLHLSCRLGIPSIVSQNNKTLNRYSKEVWYTGNDTTKGYPMEQQHINNIKCIIDLQSAIKRDVTLN